MIIDMQIDPHVHLTGILHGCPFDNPLEECAFNPIRKEAPSDRMRWLNSLPEKDRKQFIGLHVRCISRREERLWVSP